MISTNSKVFLSSVSVQTVRCLTGAYANKKARSSVVKSQKFVKVKLESRKPPTTKKFGKHKEFNSMIYTMRDTSALFDIKQVNKTVHQRIDTFLSSSTEFQDLVTCGFQITKVKISPNFRTTYIFWSSSDTSEENPTEILLKEKAAAIRQQLEFDNILPQCPQLEFIRDFRTSWRDEVEKAFSNPKFHLPEEKDMDHYERNEGDLQRTKKISDITETKACVTNFEIRNGESCDGTTSSAISTLDLSQNQNQTQTCTTSENSQHKTTDICHLKADIYGVDHEAIMMQVVKKKSFGKSGTEQALQLNFEKSLKDFTKLREKSVWAGQTDIMKQWKKERKQKDKILVNAALLNDTPT